MEIEVRKFTMRQAMTPDGSAHINRMTIEAQKSQRASKGQKASQVGAPTHAIINSDHRRHSSIVIDHGLIDASTQKQRNTGSRHSARERDQACRQVVPAEGETACHTGDGGIG